jgi:hypothetical protein
MFVIDVSGSMENLVVEKERFQDGGYPSLLRIDIVQDRADPHDRERSSPTSTSTSSRSPPR